jgi:hypothetical protein
MKTIHVEISRVVVETATTDRIREWSFTWSDDEYSLEHLNWIWVGIAQCFPDDFVNIRVDNGSFIWGCKWNLYLERGYQGFGSAQD